jgi:dienelactone hydrolase
MTPVRVPIDEQWLLGELGMPAEAHGIVLFAHGSGSSRHSPRNQYVARALERHGLATLLIDLLTPVEEAIDDRTAQYRFDIEMLAGRLATIVDWLGRRKDTSSLPIGVFGASTGGGAALMAAAARPKEIAAVVSRGGRPDLAGTALPRVAAPTLLIVGGLDTPVIQMNRDAMRRMRAEVTLEIVPGATHLFEEPGALERVAELASNWFRQHLQPAPATGPGRRGEDEHPTHSVPRRFFGRAGTRDRPSGEWPWEEPPPPLLEELPFAQGFALADYRRYCRRAPWRDSSRS